MPPSSALTYTTPVNKKLFRLSIYDSDDADADLSGTAANIAKLLLTV
jgi:hypothetical protein